MCTAGVVDGGAGATTGGADAADNGGAATAPSSTALNPPQVNNTRLCSPTRTSVVNICTFFLGFRA